MEEKDYTEIIDKYLRKEMSPAEEEAFLLQVRKDKQLAQELELYADIQQAIIINSNQRLKKLFQAQEKKHENKMVSGWLWKLAASILLLTTFGYFVYQYSSKDAGSIYSQYYSPYPNTVSPLKRSDSTVKQNGFQSYESGDYELAIQQLSENLKSEPEDDAVQFYLAQSHLALGETEEAITHLKKVNIESPFYDPALWYLGLAWLKSGEVKKAQERFRIISKSSSSYARRSAEILQKL